MELFLILQYIYVSFVFSVCAFRRCLAVGFFMNASELSKDGEFMTVRRRNWKEKTHRQINLQVPLLPEHIIYHYSP